MSKESKERIKQKKKERQKVLLQEVENKEEPETLEKTVENLVDGSFQAEEVRCCHHQVWDM